jgi:Zn finger protein HypA/HybF involved in hydrogenase expression
VKGADALNISHKVLGELEKYGVRVGERSEKELMRLGIKVTENVVYWENDRFRLNYMLQTAKKCEKAGDFIPDAVEVDDQGLKCPPCQCEGVAVTKEDSTASIDHTQGADSPSDETTEKLK